MYELSFLINPNVSEEELSDIIKRLKDAISRSGGQIIKDFFHKRIHLAYPVKKLRQAFLVYVDFELERDKIESIKNQIKDIKNIIRHLIIIKHPEKIKPIRAKKAFKPKAKPKTKEKIKIEELDKKLEEILET